MIHHLTVTRRYIKPGEIAGQPIRINSPACGALAVPVDAWWQDETANLIIRRSTSWARCTACDATLFSRRSADELVGRSPQELERLIVLRVSLIRRVLIILACLLFFWPLLGLMVSIAAFIAGRPLRGGRGAPGR